MQRSRSASRRTLRVLDTGFRVGAAGRRSASQSRRCRADRPDGNRTCAGPVARAARRGDRRRDVERSPDTLFATVTRDNKRVLFGSDRDGTPQAYLGRFDDKSAPPAAITRGPERVAWATFTRDETAILFVRDQGADEFFAIYRVGLDGAGLTNLTPNGKLHRDAPLLLPRGKPELMVYMQHPVVDPSSELVVQSVATGEPKIVYRDPLPAYAADVTADGSRALVLHVVSQNDVSVLDVDLASGAARRIYPAQGTKEGIRVAAYSSDGKRAFVATDAGTDRALVRAVDIATGTVVETYEETNPKTAIISTMYASPTGDRVSVLVDAGSHTEVRILDARKLKLERTVRTPLGWINVAPFTDDGKTFFVSIGVPERPYDIFRVDAELRRAHGAPRGRTPGARRARADRHESRDNPGVRRRAHPDQCLSAEGRRI